MSERVYNENGFDAEGIHRDTGSRFNPDGHDIEGFNANGFDAEGYSRDGYDADGYDRRRFDEDGIHRDTGTEFNPGGRTQAGRRFDSEGYDVDGRDVSGYDRDGYDVDGYDRDDEDQYGNSRCDNGDCEDEFCDCRRANCDELLDSDACVLEETGWRRAAYKRTAPTVAFEFECISDTTANAGAEALQGPFDRAYQLLVNKTRYGRGSIAKQDGSLPDETGVEFVTVPMTLAEHRAVLAQAFPGGRLGNRAVSAWNKTKCGMHVHVNRKSLSPLTLGKMLCFMYEPHNTSFHIDIAGRVSDYAEFHPHRRFVSNGLPAKAYDGRKYSALNVKDETVEFRIFRPSCRLAALLKNLCYCLAVRDFCVQSSASRHILTWENFLLWLGKTQARIEYRELDAWLRTHDSTWAATYRSTAKPLPKPKPAEVAVA